MFVIFGLDDAKPEIFTTRTEKYCNHCHNTSFWQAAKHQSRISLFFIPLIPIKTKYYFLCPICKNGEEISQDYFYQLNNNIDD
ncbi:MAG: zinc-ribbon domain-containing protein [Bacteroidetes bacterium 4572_77]|nr:MAG: zinc-ribbon domain-containing protein [Bacteroidetes bacterium 4572_77]